MIEGARERVGIAAALGLASALALLLVLLAPAPARGAIGDLTGAGCISDVGDPAGCGTTQQGLAGTRELIVSADGRSAYAVGAADDAVTHFQRVPETGALVAKGCISDVGDTAGCGVTAQGLDHAIWAALSPDGKSLYVTGQIDGAIARFERDTTTGALTPKGCISALGDPAGCGATARGLAAAEGLAVSPDGRSVYVVSGGEHTVVHFQRDPATGALTDKGCIADAGDLAGCGTTAEGLSGARAVAVSPDSKSVYVASASDGAIVRFERNTTTGALTPKDCVADLGKGICAQEQQGLTGAFSVIVSPEGNSVYATGFAEDVIMHFQRNTTTGALTPKGCIADAGDAAGCGGATQEGLDGANRIGISAEGRSVYVPGIYDKTLVAFDRDTTTGVLTPRGCFEDPGSPAACVPTQLGLFGAYGATVSPDGNSVYVGSNNDSAVVSFTREPAPACSDAFDNDGDGTTDFPADPGCTSAADDDETDPEDTTAPDFKLNAKRKQKSAKKIVAKGSCDEACTATAKGTIKIPIIRKRGGKGRKRAAVAKKKKFKLKTARKEIAAGGSKRLKLKVPKKAKKKLKKALRAGKASKATIKATAEDGAGNTSPKRKAKVKIKKKRRKRK